MNASRWRTHEWSPGFLGSGLAARSIELGDEAIAVPHLALGAEAGGLGLGDGVVVVGRLDEVGGDDLARKVEAIDAISLQGDGQGDAPRIQRERDALSLSLRCAEASGGDDSLLHAIHHHVNNLGYSPFPAPGAAEFFMKLPGGIRRFAPKMAAPAVERLGIRRVASYRLYGLDGVSKVASGEWFEADDDEAAIEAAREKLDGQPCELWQGPRFVARLERKHRR